MIGRLGRAEVLAAVALVVGARQEPITAFRRLAADDPDLGRLSDLAQHLATGVTLPDALVAMKFLSREDATRLALLPPATLAGELTRLAQSTAWPPLGEVLSRWLPVWVILVATIPSLLLGAIVAVVAGSLYGGIWHSLGFYEPVHGPAVWWLVQLAEAAVALGVVTGAWMLIRRIPVMRYLTVFSLDLNRAAALAALVRDARSGCDTWRTLTAWIRVSGDPAGVRAAVAQCGGDTTAALISLGVVPRDAQGRPDFEIALCETEAARNRSAESLAPWLIAVLVLAGLYGFLTWEMEPNLRLLMWWNWDKFVWYFDLTMVALLGIQVLTILKIAGFALLAAHGLLLLAWISRWISGSARDWPLVADRVARAMDRREDVRIVLQGLRLVVGAPMRRRLDIALSLGNEHHPGWLLARSGAVPQAQVEILTHSEAADVPTILRSLSETPDDQLLRSTASQAIALMFLVGLLTLLQFYLLETIFPKYKTMMDAFNMSGGRIWGLSYWAAWLGVIGFCVFVAAGTWLALAQRLGWWAAGGDWPRLARGLVLRRMLAAGASESTLATAVGAITPRLMIGCTAAAQRGDLPGVLAEAGWPVPSSAGLERAISADLLVRDRRKSRLALGCRLVMPFLAGLPICMTAMAVMMGLCSIQRSVIDIASSHERGTTTFQGGATPGMALLYWWGTRYAEQADAAVKRVHDDLHPDPDWVHAPQPKAPR
jgi:hypothetical protein